MPEFRKGVPVVTNVPLVTVDGTLAPGSYRFQLVVTDDSGNRSRPAFLEVTVDRPGIVDPTRPRPDPRIPSGPPTPTRPPFGVDEPEGRLGRIVDSVRDSVSDALDNLGRRRPG